MFAITYLAAFLSIVLSVSAVGFLLLHRTSRLAHVLILYAAAAAVWIGGNAAADVAYTPSFLILASGIAFIGGALSILMFLILVDVLIDERMPSRFRLLTYSLPTIGVSVFAFSEIAILDTYFPIGSPAQIVPGPLYMATLIIMLASLVYGIVRLIFVLEREQRETRRIQLSYVLFGLIIMLLGGLTFDIVLPLIGELRFYTLGPIASLFFIVTTGYAIAAHRLIDIRFQIQRSMVYSFLFALIVCMYSSALSLVLLLSPLTSDTAIYVSAGVTMVTGILFAPLLERYFKKVTDPIFFRVTYDYAETLHDLSSILYQEIELNELVSKSEQKLAQTLRTDVVRIQYGEQDIDEPDFEAVMSGHVLAIPIAREGVYSGSIHVGPKLSGDRYTALDRKLLETFAYHAATAFSRVKLHEKVVRHSHELERTVAARTQELRTMQENERQMLLDLSHNLQTPLAIFMARLEQLKRREPANRDIHSIEQPIRRLSEFIYDLLAFARLENERSDAHEILNLSRLLVDIVEELEIIAGDKDVRIKRSVEPYLFIKGDERRLREVFMNIASNALSYMDGGSDRCISIILSREEKSAHITITDTGRGISEHELPHVFERFYRGSSTKGVIHGNGLGLSIAERIVKQHRGFIWIDSKEGYGTTVQIRIPHSPSKA